MESGLQCPDSLFSEFLMGTWLPGAWGGITEAWAWDDGSMGLQEWWCGAESMDSHGLCRPHGGWEALGPGKPWAS